MIFLSILDAIGNAIVGLFSESISLFKKMGAPIFENKYLHFIEMLAKYTICVLLVIGKYAIIALLAIGYIIWLLCRGVYKFGKILYKFFTF